MLRPAHRRELRAPARRATGPATRVGGRRPGFIGCEAAASLAMRGAAASTLVSDEGDPARSAASAPRPGGASPRWLRSSWASSCVLGAPSRARSTRGPRPRAPAREPLAADLVLLGAGRHARAPSWRATAGLAIVRDGRHVAVDARMRTRRRRRARRRRRGARRTTPPPGRHCRRALGRGAQPRRGRGPRARRRGRAVGRRARLLVDDRRAHAQVRRVGRRLRRGPRSTTTATARSRSGTAATGRPSACSPTTATRTTSAAASDRAEAAT